MPDEANAHQDPVVWAVPSFEMFYRTEYAKVLGLAFALGNDRSTAEDLVQEAFAAAYRRWREVSTMQHPEGWLRKTVANRSVSHFRRLRVEGRYLARHREEAADEMSPDAVAVWAAIRRLPQRQMEAIVLTVYTDLTVTEAATAMGCSPETVKTHLERARLGLRKMLEDHDE